MAARAVSPLIRAALFVADADRAADFYRSAFGFSETYYAGTLDNDAAGPVVGAPAGSSLRCRILRGDGPNFGMVGLFEIQPVQPPPLAKDPARISLGESCLVFYCSDLDATVTKALAGGAAMLCAPRVFEMPHESQREAMIRDPDGFAINLVERDPERAFQTQTLQG